eukprot:366145-Chlamydomonas_euryale.AAC.3
MHANAKHAPALSLNQGHEDVRGKACPCVLRVTSAGTSKLRAAAAAPRGSGVDRPCPYMPRSRRPSQNRHPLLPSIHVRRPRHAGARACAHVSAQQRAHVHPPQRVPHVHDHVHHGCSARAAADASVADAAAVAAAQTPQSPLPACSSPRERSVREMPRETGADQRSGARAAACRRGRGTGCADRWLALLLATRPLRFGVGAKQLRSQGAHFRSYSHMLARTDELMLPLDSAICSLVCWWSAGGSRQHGDAIEASQHARACAGSHCVLTGQQLPIPCKSPAQPQQVRRHRSNNGWPSCSRDVAHVQRRTVACSMGV